MMAMAAIAGCRADPADPVAAGMGHTQMVASFGERYIWDCTMQSNRGAAPWQFVLRRVGEAGRQDVVLREAGQPVARRMEQVVRDEAARIYRMRDGGQILVASDGEARGKGQGGSLGAEYTTGSCSKGGQPA